MSNGIDSQELGLEMAVIFGGHLYGLKHLHYGLWNNGLTVSMDNLAAAQENYCEFLLENIPDGVKTILDVGCGTGNFARRLVEKGYQVDCVTPSQSLIRMIEANTEGKCDLHRKRFEDFTTDKTYDLILFSESFQYIPMEACFDKAMSLLKDEGHVLICDFFKRDKRGVEGKSPLSGGHKIVRFGEVVKQYPLTELKRVDITERTAPNLDLMDDLLRNIAAPSVDSVARYIQGRCLFRFIWLVVHFLFRKRFQTLGRKYLAGDRNAASFAKYKQYLLLLFQKRAETTS